MHYLYEAIANLAATKLRTLLAMLGIIIGTASIVGMVSSGQLATNQALAQFKTLGINMLSLSLFSQGNNDSGTDDDVDINTVTNMPHVIPAIRSVAPYTTLYIQSNYKDQTLTSNIIGATQSLANVIKIKMYSGRFISDLDNYAYYCVIGQQVLQKLSAMFGDNLIGKQLKIGTNYFTIIGIADEWQENSFFNQDVNNAIIIPVKTSLAISKYVKINNIALNLVENVDLERVKEQISQYLIGNNPNKKIFFRSAKELVKSMAAQHKIFTWLLGLIGSISLIVGGIGVMNIMLVSVLERRREIGIRLALGARRHDIQRMFLGEAVVLALVGGVLGIILGIIITYIVAKFAHWEFSLLFWPIFIGFTVSAIIGIASGYYPALKAAQLDPIQTLRTE